MPRHPVPTRSCKAQHDAAAQHPLEQQLERKAMGCTGSERPDSTEEHKGNYLHTEGRAAAGYYYSTYLCTWGVLMCDMYARTDAMRTII